MDVISPSPPSPLFNFWRNHCWQIDPAARVCLSMTPKLWPEAGHQWNRRSSYGSTGLCLTFTNVQYKVHYWILGRYKCRLGQQRVVSLQSHTVTCHNNTVAEKLEQYAHVILISMQIMLPVMTTEWTFSGTGTLVGGRRCGRVKPNNLLLVFANMADDSALSGTNFEQDFIFARKGTYNAGFNSRWLLCCADTKNVTIWYCCSAQSWGSWDTESAFLSHNFSLHHLWSRTENMHQAYLNMLFYAISLSREEGLPVLFCCRCFFTTHFFLPLAFRISFSSAQQMEWIIRHTLRYSIIRIPAHSPFITTILF